MEVTRKAFISSVGAALAVATITSPGEAFISLNRGSEAGRAVNKFAPHVGSKFEMITGDGHRGTVVLREFQPGRSVGQTEQFSLVFEARNGASIPEGMHTLKHPSIGSLDIFVTRDRQASVLRADFNLLKA